VSGICSQESPVEYLVQNTPDFLTPSQTIEEQSNMLAERASGILLHPTSLPGRYGIGDFGQAAFDFVDYLASAKMTRWQVLPLGPTGYGDSPYAALSSFAGNPLLVSLDQLVIDGILDVASLDQIPDFPNDRVDYGWVIYWKMPILRRAALNFLANSSEELSAQYDAFCQAQSHWLDDYALFIAVKKHFDAQAAENQVSGAVWSNYWDRDIATRQPEAMARWREACHQEVAIQKVLQFFFFRQWLAVKQYANEKGILIIGDLPIFVAQDSADVWASPESFLLDEGGNPKLVAGVPPDYFSTTGQRWGNPLYNWQNMKRNKFAWWIRRFQGTRELYDIIRVDHFRGFEACWSIPASEETAVNGAWVKVPGHELFKEVRRQLPGLALLAEDLGLITDEVDKLRDDYSFPGMRVLQFAFDSMDERCRMFLPHNYIPNCVVYTGTHDNDTIQGWFDARTPEQQRPVLEYLGCECGDVAWAFIRLAMGSAARLCVIPMQDVLQLGSDSRMNKPSTLGGNWSWRVTPNYQANDYCERLAKFAALFDR
jgi:4-alpha-glucanotransferase